jgi:hypothetical protein
LLLFLLLKCLQIPLLLARLAALMLLVRLLLGLWLCLALLLLLLLLLVVRACQVSARLVGLRAPAPARVVSR